MSFQPANLLTLKDRNNTRFPCCEFTDSGDRNNTRFPCLSNCIRTGTFLENEFPCHIKFYVLPFTFQTWYFCMGSYCSSSSS